MFYLFRSPCALPKIFYSLFQFFWQYFSSLQISSHFITTISCKFFVLLCAFIPSCTHSFNLLPYVLYLFRCFHSVLAASTLYPVVFESSATSMFVIFSPIHFTKQNSGYRVRTSGCQIRCGVLVDPETISHRSRHFILNQGWRYVLK